MAERRRTRLPREQARERILSVALDLLREGGPTAVTLVAVAKAVGVSHQAVSYHFKTREQLLEVTTVRALDRLYRDVLASVAETLHHPEQALLRLLTTLRDEGHARVLASLIVQGEQRPETAWSGALSQLKAAMAAVVDRDEASRGEAARVLELVLSFALGQAVFGRHLRQTLAIEDGPSRDQEMVAWLVKHLPEP